MPNYITNRLRIEGKQEDIDLLLNSIRGDKTEESDEKVRVIDFNKIVPMPSALNIPSMIGKGHPYVEQYRLNIKKYGYPTWYEWSVANWGTKWNSMDTEMINENTIRFVTAWGGVPDLMKKISKSFPNVTLYYDFADEDTGYNVGSYIMHDNEVTFRDIQGGSKEAYELAFEVGAADPNEYEFINGKYVWKDKIDEEY